MASIFPKFCTSSMKRKTVAELEKIIAAIEASQSIAIITHMNPEGDTIGSALACYHAFRDLGKRTTVYSPDPLLPELLFLPGAKEIRHSETLEEGYELCIVLDCTDRSRTAKLLNTIPPSILIINIDHHKSNSRFGNLNWVDGMASSTGEMVYRLFKAMGRPISREIATALYAAILTDTGSFRYSNTSPECLRAAAELLELGARPEEVAEELFEKRDLREILLLSEALARMELNADRTIAWITLPRYLMERTGVGLEETEGFINYPRSIRGVRVALLFKEISPSSYRVSLRSKGEIDVSLVAAAFSGGGHRNAAGCIVEGELKEVKRRVLEEVSRVMDGG